MLLCNGDVRSLKGKMGNGIAIGDEQKILRHAFPIERSTGQLTVFYLSHSILVVLVQFFSTASALLYLSCQHEGGRAIKGTPTLLRAFTLITFIDHTTTAVCRPRCIFATCLSRTVSSYSSFFIAPLSERALHHLLSGLQERLYTLEHLLRGLE